MNRRIVCVRWLDHYSRNESTEIDEEVGPATCLSVGFVTGETDEWLAISRDVGLSEEGDAEEKDATLCILKNCILTIRDLHNE